MLALSRFARTTAASGLARGLAVDAVKYTGVGVATGGGRIGSATSNDLTVELSMPTSMGGEGKPGATNPEDLFSLTYSSCFLGAMNPAAAELNTALPEGTTVTAAVSFGTDTAGGFAIKADLTVDLPGMPADEAQALVEKAHTICPYSKALVNGAEVTVGLA